MTAAMAMPGNTASTFLIHYFGGGLEGDDRFVIDRFRALACGDIRPVEAETRGNRLTPEALRFRLLLAFASGGARSYVKPASDQQPAEAPWTRYSRAS